MSTKAAVAARREALGIAAARRHRRAVGMAALLGLPMVALQLGGPATRLALRFEPDAIAGGEWWRMLTAHLPHLSGTHLALNLAGLLLCAALAPDAFQPRALPRLLLRWGLLSLGVSLGLLLGSPEVAHYVGLSGVLYGLFLWSLAPAAWQGDAAARLTLAGLLTWALWQGLAGPLAAEAAAIGGPIVAVAHLYGLAAGAVGVLIDAGLAHVRARARTRSRQPSVEPVAR